MKYFDSFNLYLFNQGKLEKAYDLLGSHIVKDDNGKQLGTIFRVYAPFARIVSVIGDFNNWDSRVHVLNKIDDQGIYELYIEGVYEWAKYRYVIVTQDNRTLYKSDPYGFFSDFRPETCSKVYDIDGYYWHDQDYLDRRKKSDHLHEPITIYEMNIGSWMKKPDGSFNKYNELPPLLIPYLKKMGFNTVEFMPLIEFPLDESWGYQGTGYYSVTSRYGVPKDLMYLIDELHKNDIKVLFDWVPGHICKDPHGLYEFDGSHLYEFDDEQRRENVEWGTANMDFAKGPTKSFFLSNAMFYMEYFHVDGFRLDAVSNIYYFLGNQYNGINYDGINFLRELSIMVKDYDPNVILSAEDSTTFPNVTKPARYGGVGFDYKWNMGWMNDTLRYFSKDPIYRKYHQNLMTFSLVYAYSERFCLPLSHDEVVHGKHSLIDKMPGDYWQKFANFRALIGWMFTHPGKKLLFMGGEFAQFHEWKDKEELDWFLLQYDKHREAQRFVADMAHVYLAEKALYKGDDDKDSFRWIDASNYDQSVFSYYRIKDGELIVVVL
nr:1,4-alpha-glucan branching protein GlgB [Gammaproteobacteria bacterium]